MVAALFSLLFGAGAALLVARGGYLPKKFFPRPAIRPVFFA
jgi:hypothetical protein